MKTALALNRAVKSPMLVVDLVPATTGEYVVIEYSPLCQVETPAELLVRGIPGIYVCDPVKGFRFREAKYWLDELALKEFLKSAYLESGHQAPVWAGRAVSQGVLSSVSGGQSFKAGSELNARSI